MVYLVKVISVELSTNMKKAFSLIELLVVIAIIGILTVIVAPNFMGARERASDSQKKQNLIKIRDSLRMYYNDHQSYPNSLAEAASYLPVIENYDDYQYTRGATGDTFRLGVELEAAVVEDLHRSWTDCGISGEISTNMYYVCAK